ncbi:NAD(P)/FAD-dependent oxidoreductase [Gottfriedia acidiceleris]|uniref:NAD(P)-binding protein n=1 Tax=Gottfriedia acidiceleris TaxID=371036 RepID=A0ABY4JJP1_9BACI|nr:NAD(P)/FAD-dependent oxidoreductase [Gottfriedia acidiceleris]UPM54059.1 NAD(P)-binding protein [Gottfriedia acidiceleris]
MNLNQIDGHPKWDVTILGGGIAGLTASIYLAQAGKKVLLLDKASKLGGRGISNTIGDAQLNLGAHALYTNCSEILNEVGVTVSGKLPKLSGSFILGNQSNQMKIIEAFNLFLGNHLKWKEKMEFIRFYRHIRKMDLDEINHISLEEYLNRKITSDRVKNIILAFIRVSTFTSNSEIISAGVAIGQLRSAKVLYINEGWQSIVNDLIKKANQFGVTIQKSTVVSKITGSYPNINLILKNDTRINTSCLLSTINPIDLVKLIDEPISDSFLQKCNQMIPVKAACLDLVMNGLPNPKLNFALGVDQPWYFSNHSTVAKLSNKEGEIVVHLMKYLNSVNETDSAKDEEELEGLLDLLQPGWRDYVISKRYLPKLVVSNDIKKPFHKLDNDLSNSDIGLEGIYVAGDWVGETELLLNASLTSVKNATKLINEKLELQLI